MLSTSTFSFDLFPGGAFEVPVPVRRPRVRGTNRVSATRVGYRMARPAGLEIASLADDRRYGEGVKN
jgi:hypothetical protein